MRTDAFVAMLAGMTAPASQGILSVRLPDIEALHKSFMPFLKSGGLFVPSTQHYTLGQDVFVMVTLPDETERRAMAGPVAWINTAPTAGRPPGIGVQFADGAKNEELRSRIEVLLAGYAHPDKPTYTM